MCSSANIHREVDSFTGLVKAMCHSKWLHFTVLSAVWTLRMSIVDVFTDILAVLDTWPKHQDLATAGGCVHLVIFTGKWIASPGW